MGAQVLLFLGAVPKMWLNLQIVSADIKFLRDSVASMLSFRADTMCPARNLSLRGDPAGGQCPLTFNFSEAL